MCRRVDEWMKRERGEKKLINGLNMHQFSSTSNSKFLISGVRIAPENGSTTVLSLYYTDVTTDVASHILANFTVPKFSSKWMKFAFRVSLDNVTLFFNCTETEIAPIERKPLKLVFDSASTLYLAQAGPVIGDAFEVSGF